MLTSLRTRARHGWVDFSGPHPTSVIDGNLPQQQKALVPSGRLWELGVGTLPQATSELDAEAQRILLVWDLIKETWILFGP